MENNKYLNNYEIIPPLYIANEDQNCESNNIYIKYHDTEKRFSITEKKIYNTYIISILSI